MRTVPYKKIKISEECIIKISKKDGFVRKTFIRSVEPGYNFLSITRTIEVEFIEKKKDFYFLKQIPPSGIHQDFCMRSNFFYRELSFYQIILPKLRKKVMRAVDIQLKIPIFKDGKANDYWNSQNIQMEDRDDFILMVDMKYKKFLTPERVNSLDFSHCVLVVRALAQIHALSHAYKEKKNVPSLAAVFPQMEKVFWGDFELETLGPVLQLNFQNLLHSIEFHKGRDSQLFKSVQNFLDRHPRPWELLTKLCGQISDKDAAALRKIPQRNFKYRKRNYEGNLILNEEKEIPPWSVLCVGDCKQGNTMFKYDEKIKDKPIDVILLDFQIYLEASPIVDLVYFIYNCTEKETRQEYLKLLNIYAEEFNSFCSQVGVKTMEGFDIDLLKKRFDSYKLLGFLFAVLILPQNHCRKEKIVDFEQLHDQNLRPEEMIEKCSPKSFNDDRYLSQRLFDIVEEMVDDEII